MHLITISKLAQVKESILPPPPGHLLEKGREINKMRGKVGPGCRFMREDTCTFYTIHYYILVSNPISIPANHENCMQHLQMHPNSKYWLT